MTVKTRVALIRAGRGFAASVITLGAGALASPEVRAAIESEPWAGAIFALIPAALLALDKLRRWVD